MRDTPSAPDFSDFTASERAAVEEAAKIAIDHADTHTGATFGRLLLAWRSPPTHAGFDPRDLWCLNPALLRTALLVLEGSARSRLRPEVVLGMERVRQVETLHGRR